MRTRGSDLESLWARPIRFTHTPTRTPIRIRATITTPTIILTRTATVIRPMVIGVADITVADIGAGIEATMAGAVVAESIAVAAESTVVAALVVAATDAAGKLIR